MNLLKCGSLPDGTTASTRISLPFAASARWSSSGSRWTSRRQYPWRADCVKLRFPLFNQLLTEESGRRSWLRKTNARIHRARVQRRRVPSIAVRHVKAPATQSSLIVIAGTMPVREISELAEGHCHKKAQKTQRRIRAAFMSFEPFVLLRGFVRCGGRSGISRPQWLSLMPRDHHAQMLGHRRIQVT